MPASPPGNYPIVPTLIDPNNRQTNYVVTLVNGTLTVTDVATPRAVMVAQAYSSPGSLVDVGVYLAAQGDENSVAFSLAFDPTRLSYVSSTQGSAMAPGSTFITNAAHASAGKLGVLLGLPVDTTFPSGTQQLAIITFRVSETIVGPADLAIDFTDQPAFREVGSVNADVLPANYIGGAVKVFTGFEGDANGDGNVAATDWTLIGRLVAGLSTVTDPGQFMWADCAPRSTKGDGHITATDWTQAGRYVVGLDPIQTIGGSGGLAGSLSLAAKPADLTPKDQSGRSLRLVGTGAEAGTVVQVPAEVIASGDENTLAFSVTFVPSDLEFVSAVPGSGLPPGAQVILNTNNAAAGRVGALIGLTPGAAFAAGTHQVLVLSLRVKPDKGNLEVAFSDSPVWRQFVSVHAEALPGDFINATIIAGPVDNTLQLDLSRINDLGAG